MILGVCTKCRRPGRPPAGLHFTATPRPGGVPFWPRPCPARPRAISAPGRPRAGAGRLFRSGRLISARFRLLALRWPFGRSSRLAFQLRRQPVDGHAIDAELGCDLRRVESIGLEACDFGAVDARLAALALFLCLLRKFDQILGELILL